MSAATMSGRPLCWVLGWLLALPVPLLASTDRETVTVDVRGAGKDFPHYWKRVIGAGHAPLHLREDFQEHLGIVSEELGFRSVRCHGIFEDALEICHRDASGELSFDWSKIDVIYDAYLARGVRPFIELSFMPSALASGEATVFHYEGNVTPPRDYAEWAQLITAFVEHLIDRYGKEEVLNWPFEVWNEPDLRLFWAGTREEYFKLFDVTLHAIKAIDPALRVGGPSIAGPKYLPSFIAYCAMVKEEPLPLDFISFHTYCGNIRGSRAAYAPISTMPWFVKQIRDVLDRSPYRDLPVEVTEWNSTSKPWDPGHDEPLNAAFVCEAISVMAGQVDGFAFWTVSDVFEEHGLPTEAFHGGFGLITIDGLRKPAFHAFALLSELEGKRLEVDSDQPPPSPSVPALAVRDPEGAMRVMAWNWPFYNPRNARGSRSIELVLRGYDAGQALTVRRAQLDENHGDVKKAWMEMGSPAKLDEDQRAALSKADELWRSPWEDAEASQEGDVHLALELLPGAVVSWEIREK